MLPHTTARSKQRPGAHHGDAGHALPGAKHSASLPADPPDLSVRRGRPAEGRASAGDGDSGPGLVESERCARCNRLPRAVGEPLLVVLQQEPPGPGVLLDDLEDRPALSGDQRMAVSVRARRPTACLSSPRPRSASRRWFSV
jgi:hypothetical protein